MRTQTNLPGTVRRIVLTGFMGAGKSTIGDLLAQRLRWQFVDTDAVIEARVGLSIARIFAEQGESVFRALEAQAIRDHVQADEVVLALGGGAVESEGAREALSAMKDGCVVFLDAPLEVLLARCLSQPGAAERPILRDRDRLKDRLAARLPHYRSAHLTVTTEGMTPERVTRSIVEALASCRILLRKDNVSRR
ncbi:MAG: shikimate kinase [Acidobacteriaceae bacterium]|nr:shikimate kinase [Acidobacteriaceae bacterium]